MTFSSPVATAEFSRFVGILGAALSQHHPLGWTGWISLQSKGISRVFSNTTVHHDSVITHLEPDILECEVKWALGSITTNKASGGNGIPVELFPILKDDAVKVLHSVCQQMWKTQQWPQD